MQRFEQNAPELEQALQLIEKAAGSPALNAVFGRGLLEITKRYTQTFLWLQRYDVGLLEEPKRQKGGILPRLEDAEKGYFLIISCSRARFVGSTVWRSE